MKLLTTLAGVLFLSSALAATEHYQIDSKIFVGGKLVSAPRLVTNPNEAAEIKQVSDDKKETLMIKVVASDVTNEHVSNGILMKFDVSYTANGKTINSSPQILANSGEPASIEVTALDGKPAMKLEVTANRK